MLKSMNLIPAIAVLGMSGTAALAQPLSVQIENTSVSDGFFFTPFWISASNGSFDSFSAGASAGGFPGITEIAEGGDTGPISTAFGASGAGMAGGVQATVTSVAFGGDAPVFSPGESTTYSLDVGDSSVNRYFSFASMVIPSNDLFIGNDNPMAYELFNGSGMFNGPMVIEIYGRDVYDNGSEYNSATGGAAFSANGGASVSESMLIRSFFTDGGDQGYLDSFIGSGTANGATIGSSFGSGDLIARITINQVPAPSGVAALVAGGLVMGRRCRSA